MKSNIKTDVKTIAASIAGRSFFTKAGLSHRRLLNCLV